MATSHDQVVHDKGFVMNKKHKSIFIMMIAHMQPLISMMCGGRHLGAWGKGADCVAECWARHPQF